MFGFAVMLQRIQNVFKKKNTQFQTKNLNLLFKVLDTKCFERLLGKCTDFLKAGIQNYKYTDGTYNLDQDF